LIPIKVPSLVKIVQEPKKSVYRDYVEKRVKNFRRGMTCLNEKEIEKKKRKYSDLKTL
jgi:hypothetical protein